jgi:hypothetical protein
MRMEDRIDMIHRIIKRDGEGCFYCHIDLPIEKITLDHFIPKAVGGLSNFENFRNSCQKCNNRKGSLVPDGKRHPVPPPRPARRTRAEKQAMRAMRAVCESCFDGRLNTETCTQCGSRAVPPGQVAPYPGERRQVPARRPDVVLVLLPDVRGRKGC